MTDPWVPLTLYRDGFGNWCTRLVAPAGAIRITSDAIITDRGVPDPVVPSAPLLSVENLPEETLVYLLGSRLLRHRQFIGGRLEAVRRHPCGVAASAGCVRLRSPAPEVWL